MVTGSSLLVQIQIAFIGIVVVLGTFYIWRMINRLEERVEKLALNCSCGPKSQSNQSCVYNSSNKENTLKTASSHPEEDQYAEEMMRVFGNSPDRGSQSHQQFVMPVIDVNDIFEKTNNGVVLTQYDDEDDEQFEEYFSKSRQQHQEHVISENADLNAGAGAGAGAVVESSADTDNFSEAETDTENPLSKSKLKRMSADKLKELCKDRNLSVDGSKALLIDRILGITRN